MYKILSFPVPGNSVKQGVYGYNSLGVAESVVFYGIFDYVLEEDFAG